MAKSSSPDRVPGAAMLIWLVMLVFGLAAATLSSYHYLRSNTRAGRFASLPDAQQAHGIIRAVSGASGDIAGEHAQLLAEVRPATARKR